eukprot:Opistho-1_new@83847
MLPNPFFGREDDKLFPDIIKNRHFIFTIFEAKRKGWKIQLLHKANVIKMEEVVKIINDIKAGNIKPIYFLMGEEPYYIDRITEYLENNLLTEDERGFNQMVLYGRDTTVDDIVSNAKRYPMMAERQVIIVKEAQELSRTIDQLEKYADNPQPT